jgi:thiamine-phosphate pyrophosphorylase
MSRMAAQSSIAGLYLLTRETADTERLMASVALALSVGTRVLQYRDKSVDSTRRVQQARGLLALCQQRGVPLIINDDVELAFAIEADGVHLGAQDVSIADARRRLGRDCIIGVSCYDNMQRASQAVAAGADYVAFGAFFDSGTKPLARRAPLQLLRDARLLPVPIVAIGGINASNGASLIEAGASALAVVGAVWDAPDIAVEVRALSSLFLTSGHSR